MLDGSFGTTSFQVGSNAYETIEVTVKDASASKLGSNQIGGGASTSTAGASAAASTVAGTVVAGSGAAFSSGTVKVVGNGQTTDVSITGTDTAKTLAAKFNGSIAGLSASARTVVEAQVAMTSGAASFNLTVGDNTVQMVGVTSTEDLATQINSNAGKLGLTANYDSKTEKLTITSSTGENIKFEAATGGAGAINVAVQGSDGTFGAASDVFAGATAVGYVKLDSANSFAVTGDTTQVFGDTKSELSSVGNIDISTADGAQRALAVVDSALAAIDSQRADLGAVQNRFDNTINNLQNISENASAARSRIMDTDYAAETANLSKNQVLQQAGTAILAQAKQLPQSVLSLLQ